MSRLDVGVHGHFMWDSYWSSGQPTSQLIQQLNSLASVGHVRVDIGFASSQPTPTWNPTSGYQLRLGAFLDLAAARGIKVILNPITSPAWSRPETAPTSSANQYPSNLVAWRTWIENMVGLFGSKVYAWEIWNEPNISAFTNITDASVRTYKYADILKAAYQGVKTVQSYGTVVFGGPSQTDSWFIDESFYRGLKGYYDVMSYHPYLGNESLSPISTDLYDKTRVTHTPSILEHMAYWRSSDVPVWWTEFGVSNHSNAGITDYWKLGVEDPEEAGHHLVQYLYLAEEKYPQVELGIIYVANKASTDIHQAGYSVMNPDGSPRPQLVSLNEYVREH